MSALAKFRAIVEECEVGCSGTLCEDCVAKVDAMLVKDGRPVDVEKGKAQAALKKLDPRVRRHYSAEYGTGLGNIEGEFKGLACRSCERWVEFGHAEHCAVADLEACLGATPPVKP